MDQHILNNQSDIGDVHLTEEEQLQMQKGISFGNQQSLLFQQAPFDQPNEMQNEEQEMEDSENSGTQMQEFLKTQKKKIRSALKSKQDDLALHLLLENVDGLIDVPFNEFGESLLQVAIRELSSQLFLEHLVSLGANYNYRTPMTGRTPLHYACIYNNEKAVNFLLCLPGIDVEAKSCGNEQSLHYAARNGNVNIVRTILLHQVNPIDLNGLTQDCTFIAQQFHPQSECLQEAIYAIEMLLQQNKEGMDEAQILNLSNIKLWIARSQWVHPYKYMDPQQYQELLAFRHEYKYHIEMLSAGCSDANSLNDLNNNNNFNNGYGGENLDEQDSNGKYLELYERVLPIFMEEKTRFFQDNKLGTADQMGRFFSRLVQRGKLTMKEATFYIQKHFAVERDSLINKLKDELQPRFGSN